MLLLAGRAYTCSLQAMQVLLELLPGSLRLVPFVQLPLVWLDGTGADNTFLRRFLA